MLNKKYQLVKEDSMKINNHTLYRVKAIRDFGNIKEGDLGGYIESEDNLSHDGNCWVYNNAKVFDGGIIQDNAEIYNDVWIHDGVKVHSDMKVHGCTRIYNQFKLFAESDKHGRILL